MSSQVVVFCATALVASLTCSLLREMKFNVRELHSNKSPMYCTKVSDEFKESKELILVTSDAAARGMNYPDVTLVVQVNLLISSTALSTICITFYVFLLPILLHAFCSSFYPICI